jgi:hypothetical protein
MKQRRASAIGLHDEGWGESSGFAEEDYAKKNSRRDLRQAHRGEERHDASSQEQKLCLRTS